MHKSTENSLSLSQIKEGKTVTIASVEGGWDYRKRITGLGFVKGCSVAVVRNSSNGPLMVEIKGSKVALGRGEAEKIRVK